MKSLFKLLEAPCAEINGYEFYTGDEFINSFNEVGVFDEITETEITYSFKEHGPSTVSHGGTWDKIRPYPE